MVKRLTRPIPPPPRKERDNGTGGGATMLLPVALIIAAFLAGQWSGNSGELELEQKYEQERQARRDSIMTLQEQITTLETESREIIQRMKEDSARTASALNAEKGVANHYRKLYESINLSGSTVRQLDSLRAVLRAGPLHQP